MINSFWRIIDLIGDLTIMAGYIFVGIKIAPSFKLKYWWTKVGAIFFFFLCGCTHASMAFEHSHGHPASPIDVIITTPQAVAVWMFVLGIYYEFVIHPTTPQTKDQ